MSENIKSKGTFCCDGFILDQYNKLSLIGIFKNIDARTLPVSHPKMTFAGIVELYGNKEVYNVLVKMISPGGKVLSEFNLTGKKESGDGDVNILIDIVNFTFQEYGKYALELYIDNDLIDTTYLNVKKPAK